jgi:hypothetical protein
MEDNPDIIEGWEAGKTYRCANAVNQSATNPDFRHRLTSQTVGMDKSCLA